MQWKGRGLSLSFLFGYSGSVCFHSQSFPFSSSFPQLCSLFGKGLFFPATGLRFGSELRLAGEYGFYWSSSLGANFPNGAWDFDFDSDDQYVDGCSRQYGFSVRAVCASQN